MSIFIKEVAQKTSSGVRFSELKNKEENKEERKQEITVFEKNFHNWED